MNIFKVLASGRKSFSEESASAVLAWLMNPAMEHGLGYAMLERFVAALSTQPNCPESFSAIRARLTARLRNEAEREAVCRCALEYNVDSALIDIVFFIDEWILSIENKIYAGSVSDADQLVREYRGVQKQHPQAKRCMVFLVPVDEGADMADALIVRSYEKLKVDSGDFKAMVTWQRNAMERTPSISNLIGQLLDDEARGLIDPIPEYTRHTLKALRAFIDSGFAGYDYERERDGNGLNDATEARVTVSELGAVQEGYVGVKAGVAGLLRLPNADLGRRGFQYTSKDMATKPYWIPVGLFRKLVEWRHGKAPDIAWQGRFESELLLRIAKDYGNKVFIGVKRGETALREMPPEVIREKQWQISTQQPTRQWIPGDTFVRILEEKKVFHAQGDR